jgi:hypothetical protein
MNNLNNTSELNLKITEGMKQVRLDLIAYKTKMNSLTHKSRPCLRSGGFFLLLL